MGMFGLRWRIGRIVDCKVRHDTGEWQHKSSDEAAERQDHRSSSWLCFNRNIKMFPTAAHSYDNRHGRDYPGVAVEDVKCFVPAERDKQAEETT